MTGGQTSSAPTVSVIVRAHREQDVDRLRSCVRSIAASDFPGAVEVLLETSNFGRRLTLEDLIGCPPGWPLTLTHSNMDLRGDTRLALMRAGIRRAAAAFVYLVDYDDVLLRRGLADLAEALQRTGAVIAIGNVGLVQRTDLLDLSIPYLSASPTVQEIVAHNSVPLNAFMVRREVAQAAIEAVPNLAMFEDYAFLLNVLTQGQATFLDPSTCVADYNIEARQDQKYDGDVTTFSQTVVNELRASLVFQVQGQELLSAPADLRRREADTQLLGALPIRYDAPLKGFIDTMTAWNGATLLSGWCCDTDDPARPLTAVYAQAEDGTYHYLPHRHDRPDVAASLAVPNAPYGFSGLVAAPALRDVFVVHGMAKFALPRVAPAI